jgi:hypothetical protein
MIEAWLDAVVETLRLQIGTLASKEIDLQPEGHPPATMGARYISVDGDSIQSVEKSCLKETYQVSVFVTVRAGVVPADRRSSLYRGHLQYLATLERSVIAALHGRQSVRVLACNKLGISTEALELDDMAAGYDGAYGDAFQQPLWYTGRGKTAFMGADWIGSPAQEADVFLMRTLVFQGGLRVQSLDIQA